MDPYTNSTILCVDDDEVILNSYEKVFAPAGSISNELLSLLRDAGAENRPIKDDMPKFNLLLAKSGEEAIRIIEERLHSEMPVVAGFFDMRMPGGIDGLETMRRARQLDDSLHCAVVTAYSDRNVCEMREIFTGEHLDELLYFNKPFLPEELEQAAINMIFSWNRKRKMEENTRIINKHRQGLAQILDAVGELSSMPPSSLLKLMKGILIHLLAIVDGEDGIAVLHAAGQKASLTQGTGHFEKIHYHEGYLLSLDYYQKSMQDNRIRIEGKSCFVPLALNTEMLGGILVESSHPLTSHPLQEILEVFRHQMVHLATNRLLYEKIIEQGREVVTDPLTNLYNRRFMTMRLEEELSRAARYGLTIAVLMIDLDDFKLINDTYGHAAGDLVLQTVAEVLRNAVRDYDMVSRNVDDTGGGGNYAIRYGGEEFSLILLHTESEGVLRVAERIRSRIAAGQLEFMGKIIKVTASIGVCVEKMSREKLADGNYLDKVIKNADKMLYRAKANGKNRVELFENTSPAPQSCS